MPKPLRYLLAPLLTVILHVPLYADVESDLKAWIQKESEGAIEILDFKPGEVVESKVQEIELRETPFTATLKFKRAGRWPKIPGDSKLEFKVVKKLPPTKGGGFNFDQLIQDTQNFGFDVEVDEKIKIEGVFRNFRQKGPWQMGMVSGHLVK